LNYWTAPEYKTYTAGYKMYTQEETWETDTFSKSHALSVVPTMTMFIMLQPVDL